jgi:hypothetical protein
MAQEAAQPVPSPIAREDLAFEIMNSLEELRSEVLAQVSVKGEGVGR